MRILFFITRSDTIGGAHIHVRDMALALGKKGHDVSVLIGGNGVFSSILENCGINVIRINELGRKINPLADLKSFLNLRKVLRKLKPDLFSIHSTKAGVIGRIASIGLDFPVVFTVHGWSVIEGKSDFTRKIYFFLEKILGFFTDSMVAVSGYDEKIALKNRVINKNRLYKIYNGIKELESEKNIAVQGDTTPDFLMVARFDKPKDHGLLIKAVSKVDNLNLTLVGDGPDLNKIKSLVNSLGLEERVKFTGEIIINEDFFKEFACFVLVTRSEGLPISILEAMRAGLPIIASDVGGCSEEVLHGKNGFLVEKNNIDDLVSRLNQLAENKSLRQEMGGESLEIFNSEFTSKIMVEQYLKLYSRLINGNKI